MFGAVEMRVAARVRAATNPRRSSSALRGSKPSGLLAPCSPLQAPCSPASILSGCSSRVTGLGRSGPARENGPTRRTTTTDGLFRRSRCIFCGNVSKARRARTLCRPAPARVECWLGRSLFFPCLSSCRWKLSARLPSTGVRTSGRSVSLPWPTLWLSPGSPAAVRGSRFSSSPPSSCSSGFPGRPFSRAQWLIRSCPSSHAGPLGCSISSVIRPPQRARRSRCRIAPSGWKKPAVDCARCRRH